MTRPTVLCYGDSNTYGFDPRGFLGDRYEADARWCDLLSRKTGWQIINLGENGRTVPRSVRALEALDGMIRETAPDLLIILLGTNDALQGQSPDVIAQGMEAMISHCKAQFPALSLLLLSPPPARLRDAAQPIAALLPLYQSIAQRQKIRFFPLPDLPLAFDGIHLSEAGHRQLAEALCAYLGTNMN